MQQSTCPIPGRRSQVDLNSFLLPGLERGPGSGADEGCRASRFCQSPTSLSPSDLATGNVWRVRVEHPQSGAIAAVALQKNDLDQSTGSRSGMEPAIHGSCRILVAGLVAGWTAPGLPGQAHQAIGRARSCRECSDLPCRCRRLKPHSADNIAAWSPGLSLGT